MSKNSLCKEIIKNDDFSLSIRRINLENLILEITNLSGNTIEDFSINTERHSDSLHIEPVKAALKELETLSLNIIVNQSKSIISNEINYLIVNANKNKLKLKFSSGMGLYVVGIFNNIGGKEANNIAMWNGTEWSALVDGDYNGINSTSALPLDIVYDSVNKGLMICGYFSQAGSVSVNNLVEYFGTAGNASYWNDVNGGTDKEVTCLFFTKGYGDGELAC